MAIMGDEDSVTGFLIAGWFIFCSNVPSVIILSPLFASQRVLKPLNLPTSDLSVFLGIGQGAGGKGTNFYICDKATTNQREIEKAFLDFTEVRKDIAILLITQGVAQHIRHLVDAHTAAVSHSLPACCPITACTCSLKIDSAPQ